LLPGFRNKKTEIINMKLKNCLPLSILLICCSCVTFKQYDSKAKESRDSNYEAFIVKKDGEIISGQSLKHRSYDAYDPYLVRVINKDDAFKIDGKKYNDSDVVVFQDKNAYHKRFNNLYLVRLVTGKMNLYYFDTTGYTKTYTYSAPGPANIKSTNNRKSSFFFEKEKDKIVLIGISEFKEAVGDNPEALEKLNKYYPKETYFKELNS
jgi:hypothetical protein